MPPPGLPPTPADKALKQEASWAKGLVTGMFWNVLVGAAVLSGQVNPDYLAGGGIALILMTLIWLLRAPARWLMGRMMIAHMMTLDILDQSLQRCLRRQAIRRRGALGTASPRLPDDRNGDDG